MRDHVKGTKVEVECFEGEKFMDVLDELSEVSELNGVG